MLVAIGAFMGVWQECLWCQDMLQFLILWLSRPQGCKAHMRMPPRTLAGMGGHEKLLGQ